MKTSKLLLVLLGITMIVSCSKTSSSASETPSTTTSEISVPVSSETPSSETSSSEVVSSEDVTSIPVSSETPSSEVSSEVSSEYVEPGEAILLGGEAEALANPGKLVLLVGEKVGLTYARTVDGASRVQFTVEEGVTFDALSLFLKNPGEGERYTLTFKVNPSVAFSGTVNGVPQDFARGENDVTVNYDENEGASLKFLFGVDESGLTLKANNVIFTEFSFVERSYDSIDDIVVDGEMDDWTNTRAFENTVGIHTTTAGYSHKSVDFYGVLRSDGLLLLADVYHDILIDDGASWWQSSNFEFFVTGNNQYYVSAKLSGEDITKSSKVTSAAWTVTESTVEGEAKYHSVVEVFVATDKFPAGAVVAGEIRVGFAWKTIGDKIDNGEAAGGGLDEYWVPKGTWVNNVDQTYINQNGIFKKSQVSFVPQTMTIDGDLSDWADKAAFTTNKVYIQGSDASSHKNVTFFAFLNEEGLFVGALAHHDVFIEDSSTWHMNTNLEFFLNGGTQYYVAANGAVGYGAGKIASKLYDAGAEAAVYETVAEAFIPKAALGAVDMLRIGFAWKTNGDTATGLGGSNGAADAWMFAAGHWPNNLNEQYYVTANGVFVTDPTAV